MSDDSSYLRDCLISELKKLSTEIVRCQELIKHYENYEPDQYERETGAHLTHLHYRLEAYRSMLSDLAERFSRLRDGLYAAYGEECGG